MKDLIEDELAKVRQEMKFDEGDEPDDASLSELSGWEKALLWVLRQLPEEGER